MRGYATRVRCCQVFFFLPDFAFSARNKITSRYPTNMKGVGVNLPISPPDFARESEIGLFSTFPIPRYSFTCLADWSAARRCWRDVPFRVRFDNNNTIRTLELSLQAAGTDG